MRNNDRLQGSHLRNYDRLQFSQVRNYGQLQASQLRNYNRLQASQMRNYDRLQARQMRNYDRLQARQLRNYYRLQGSQVRNHDRLQAGQLTHCNSIPGSGKSPFSVPVPSASCSTLWVSVAFLPGIKRLGRESDRPPPSGIEVKNDGNNSSTPPHSVMASSEKT